MLNLKDEILRRSENYLNEFIEIRRHLHQFPELSEKEQQTAKYVEEKLMQFGIPFKSGIGGYGIVACIEGQKANGKTIALRADMDALPIIEENEIDYKSVNHGVMHACGHDVHTTCLLGVARILNELRSEFAGTIKLFFQPSEEKFPGGAIRMIREGVLKNPEVECIFGQHVLPELSVGKVGFKSGKYMASTDEVYLTVKGKGGHAATPNQVIDPVLISAHIITALQQLVSRMASPYIPTVLSFGRISGEGRTNIIPDKVTIDGTLRTFDEKWRAEAHIKITELSQNIARAMGGDCEVFIDKGYPFLVNDDTLTKQSIEWAKEFLGQDNVVELEMRMTAEDFAYYSQLVPGCFYRLGTGNADPSTQYNLHTSRFNVDESSIKTGIGLMSWLTIKRLFS